MPPIELGPMRPIGAVHTPLARQTGGAKKDAAQGAEAATGLALDALSLDPGAPPIDADRVAIVRKAVESGTYPVIPAKVADAIIAAGMLLRSAK